MFSFCEKKEKGIKIFDFYKKNIEKNSNNIFYCIFWFVIKKTPEGELSIDRIEVNFSFSLQDQKDIELFVWQNKKNYATICI